MSRWWCWTMIMPMVMGFSSPSHSQSPAGSAQIAPAPGYEPSTGDVWIDARLKDINAYAARYPDAFADEVSRYLDISRGYVVALSHEPRWTPGDVYFACALGKVLAQSCRNVVRARTQDGSGGWKGIARRVAGERNSVPMRELRELLRTSYAHWARPLN